MANKVDAEHLTHLTLVPVGAEVGGAPGGSREVIVGKVGLEGDPDVVAHVIHPCQQLEAGISPGVAGLKSARTGGSGLVSGGIIVRFLGCAHNIFLGVHVTTKWRRQPVHGRQEVKEPEAKTVAGYVSGSRPGITGDPDPHVVTGPDMALDHGIAKQVGEAGHKGLTALVDLNGLAGLVGGGAGCLVGGLS